MSLNILRFVPNQRKTERAQPINLLVYEVGKTMQINQLQCSQNLYTSLEQHQFFDPCESFF